MTKNTFKTNLKRNIGFIALVAFSPVFFIHLPPSEQSSSLHLDKVFHFLFHFSFGLLFLWSKLKPWDIIFLLCGYGLIIEGIQEFTEYRSCELFDIMANTIGVVAALLFFKLKTRFNSRK